ncbi:MAG: DUF2189 domain-containing protein [Alphaproteobacteria bacterium]|nr:DUF2189 domain-containing protein [Alphaproteobacteria bacterium]
MAQEKTFRDIQVTSSQIAVRKIGVKDLVQALRKGFDDFSAKPSHIVFLIIIYPLFALLLTLFLAGQTLLHLAFPVVAGLTLLGPVVSVALFEMSRRRESGLDTSWRSAFDFMHSASYAPILALSLLMMLLYVAWLYMAQFIYFGLFGAVPLESVSDFTHQLLTTRHGGALIVYGTAVGLIFAIIALAISVVAFPLLLDRPATTVTAVTTSIRAVTSNPLIMAVWGLIVVVLLAAGAAVFLVGLIVVLPVLGHATWHLYRRLVEP